MLTGHSGKPIKGVATSEVPEVSLLYVCIDLNSCSKHVSVICSMCRIYNKKPSSCRLSAIDRNSVASMVQIIELVHSMLIINESHLE